MTRIGSKRPRLFLREWREHRQLTQEQLAARLETTKSAISRIETGKRDFTGGFLEAAADALSVEPPDLFRSPDQPSQAELLQGLSPMQRRQAIAIIETLRRTGTEG